MLIPVLESTLKNSLPEQLFNHSCKVKDWAVKLALAHNFDPEKAALAGMLHDYGRIFNPDELISKAEDLEIPITEATFSSPLDLLHGAIGAYYAKEIFAINDAEILAAINCHTFGSSEMSLLCKILFVSEKLSSSEIVFSEIEKLKNISFENIDLAMIVAFDIQIRNLLENKKIIYPQLISSRNKMLMSLKN